MSNRDRRLDNFSEETVIKLGIRVMSNRVEHTVTVCPSCSQPLAGRYCSHCGEAALDPRALTVRHFAKSIARETLQLDGKLWRTLGHLMFHPGFLTAEYCAGRRRLYIKPVRLLITAILSYALLSQGGLTVTLMLGPVILSLAPNAAPESLTVAETVRRIDRFGVLRRFVTAKEKSVSFASDAVQRQFHDTLKQFIQPLSFANVLLLAVALYAFFHRKRRLLAEHAVFSVHLVSFVLFSSLVLVAGLKLLKVDWSALAPTERGSEPWFLLLIVVVVLWQFVYLTVALHRFYFGEDPGRIRSRFKAAMAALLVYLLNSAFITGVQLLGGAIALWRL